MSKNDVLEEKITEDETLQIVVYDEETGNFIVKEEELETYLKQEEFNDSKVSVISVAGAFRRGKSFLLNFFVKYFEYVEKHGFPSQITTSKMCEEKYDLNVNEVSDAISINSEEELTSIRKSLPDWLNPSSDSDEKVHGFKWRGGSQRETNGIVVWKRPFVINSPIYGKLAVILMDTQGTFDYSSSVKICATIFALSTMLSSVQIYNLNHNVQEDDLNHLQFFTEYGRLALQHSDSKPFQKLVFLVRDWAFGYEYDHGFNQLYLDKILTGHENQPKELQLVRQHVHACFESLQCFLLPYPGENVASKKRFKGLITDISPKFLKYVSEMIENITSPDNLLPMCIEGEPLTAKEFHEYFTMYMRIFQSDELPEPKNILEATAEAGHLVAFKDAQEYYITEMQKFCGGDQPYVNKDTFKIKHENIYEKTLDVFEKYKKMGDQKIHDDYLLKLKETIDIRFEEFDNLNEGKNLLKTFRFPIITFIAIIISFLISEILEFIGLEIINAPFIYTGRFFFLFLVLWIYMSITGQLRPVMIFTNEFGNVIWEASGSTLSQYFYSTVVSQVSSANRPKTD